MARSKLVLFFRIPGLLSDHFLQRLLRDKFSRAPFIKYTRGDDHGLIGFDKALSDEEVNYVKETLKTLGSKEVTWTTPSGTPHVASRKENG